MRFVHNKGQLTDLEIIVDFGLCASESSVCPSSASGSSCGSAARTSLVVGLWVWSIHYLDGVLANKSKEAAFW